MSLPATVINGRINLEMPMTKEERGQIMEEREEKCGELSRRAAD